VFPHFQHLLENEQNKEVIEKVLECIRDLADYMGPGAFSVANLEMVLGHLVLLLNKEAFCQVGGAEENMLESDDDEEEDDEDMNHDEIILGNTTDVIISLAKALHD
jgi:hypothetical protein